MKAKVLGFIVVVLALAAATAGTAGATAPAVTEVNVDRTIPVPAGGACSFPITIHNVGLRRTTTYFDANGNVTRTVIHLVGFTQSVTNDLTGATLSLTQFTDCRNLHEAIGLDAVRHAGPSELDRRTLRASAARLPYGFLRGVGYTRSEIVAMLHDYPAEPPAASD